MDDVSTLTASEARQNLYSLIKKAAKGLKTYEIRLRGAAPVVLIGKQELEGWLETLDIMANPEEVKAIEEGRKDKTAIPLEKLLKELEDKDKSRYDRPPQKTSR